MPRYLSRIVFDGFRLSKDHFTSLLRLGGNAVPFTLVQSMPKSICSRSLILSACIIILSSCLIAIVEGSGIRRPKRIRCSISLILDFGSPYSAETDLFATICFQFVLNIVRCGPTWFVPILRGKPVIDGAACAELFPG